MEGQSNVVRRLATHANNNTAGVLQCVNIKHSLERDVLEVQTISLIVVGGDSLGVLASC
jgi:hypothetical protein